MPVLSTILWQNALQCLLRIIKHERYKLNEVRLSAVLNRLRRLIHPWTGARRSGKHRNEIAMEDQAPQQQLDGATHTETRPSKASSTLAAAVLNIATYSPGRPLHTYSSLPKEKAHR